MPGAGGQVRLELLRVVGVVEDEQPVRGGVAAQLLQGRLRCLGHVVTDLEPHLAGQIGERPAGLLGPLRRHPPDQVIVGHEAVRVLQRELGLADAAQPVQRLRDHHRPAAPGQLVAQQFQRRAAAGEVGVPGRARSRSAGSFRGTWAPRPVVPALPSGGTGRSRAHSSFAVAWAASIRARSTAGCSLKGSMILTSLTRTGIS